MTAKEALEEFIKFIVEVCKIPAIIPQTDRLSSSIYVILSKNVIDRDVTLISADQRAGCESRSDAFAR
jgi:hypothetical protein